MNVFDRANKQGISRSNLIDLGQLEKKILKQIWAKRESLDIFKVELPKQKIPVLCNN